MSNNSKLNTELILKHFEETKKESLKKLKEET